MMTCISTASGEKDGVSMKIAQIELLPLDLWAVI